MDEAFQATHTLRYESEQVLLSELWHTASASRHKVFELREKVFGMDGRGIQWTIDGQKRVVDQLGRSESEAEEERKIKEEEEEEEEEVQEFVTGIKPMWLLRFFTSWGGIT